MADEYCDLCELPRANCVHGMPAPTPPEVVKKTAAPRTKPARKAASKASPPARRGPLKWTPPEVMRPHILVVLQDAGGELDADDVLDSLEKRLDDTLREADRDRTPEGELRWRYAARRARQAMIADGLMINATPGVWQLSPSGLEASGLAED
jgi:hypothetical protein